MAEKGKRRAEGSYRDIASLAMTATSCMAINPMARMVRTSQSIVLISAMAVAGAEKIAATNTAGQLPSMLTTAARRYAGTFVTTVSAAMVTIADFRTTMASPISH